MSRFKIEKKIFKSQEDLNTGNSPLTIDEILHRKNEIDMLTYQFSSVFDGAVPNNLLMFGPTGCGKTLMIKLLTTELKKDAERDGIKLFVPYINCVDTYTNMSVMRQLLQHATIQTNLEPKKIQTSYNVYFHRFIEALNNFNGKTMIIFDEIDKLQDPSFLIYQLSRLKENEYTKNNICIIGISNDINFMSKLDVPSSAAFSENEANIPPYKAFELANILHQRAQKALHKTSYDDELINSIAKIAGKDTGDARKAIDLLRISANLAERNQRDKILLEDVTNAEKIESTEKYKKTIQTLPLHQKFAVLACMYHIAEQNKQEITITECYPTYGKFCKIASEKPKSKRTFYEYLYELDKRGVLTITKTSGGRGKGVNNIISSEMSPYDIVGLMFEDPYVDCLKPNFSRFASVYEASRKKYEQISLYDIHKTNTDDDIDNYFDDDIDDDTAAAAII